MTKGLIVNIYKTPLTAGCSNNGVSQFNDSAILIGPGIPEIFEAKEWSNIQNPYLRWLAKYTYEGVDKYPNKKTIDYLLKNFPCKSGDIYRGMNFYTNKNHK